MSDRRPTQDDRHEHGNALAEFRAFRERMNTEILGENNLVINRFFGAFDGRGRTVLRRA